MTLSVASSRSSICQLHEALFRVWSLQQTWPPIGSSVICPCQCLCSCVLFFSDTLLLLTKTVCDGYVVDHFHLVPVALSLIVRFVLLFWHPMICLPGPPVLRCLQMWLDGRFLLEETFASPDVKLSRVFSLRLSPFQLQNWMLSWQRQISRLDKYDLSYIRNRCVCVLSSFLLWLDRSWSSYWVLPPLFRRSGNTSNSFCLVTSTRPPTWDTFRAMIFVVLGVHPENTCLDLFSCAIDTLMLRCVRALSLSNWLSSSCLDLRSSLEQFGTPKRKASPLSVAWSLDS